jgi:hypothetical protein
MDSFDDRKRAQEARFAHDAELRFKAEARRAKLVGLWAAGEMGLAGDEAKAYAGELVAADFEEAGDHDLARKLRRDFDARGIAVTDEEIRRQLDQQLVVASEQIADKG